MQGQVIARPLTPGDKTTYGLPASLEVSGGISTVGIGTPVYLEAEINIAIPAADIPGVTWVLTNQPPGSVAALAAQPPWEPMFRFMSPRDRVRLPSGRPDALAPGR